MCAIACAFALTTLACSQLGRGAPDRPTRPGYAKGVVFDDRNGNGLREDGESGLAGVRVSNGEQIVRTDTHGHFSLPVGDDTIIFVIKPTGWMTPVDERNLPRFYYVHKPAGSGAELRYPGVEATGTLPESIEFGLQEQDEPARFDVLVLGDPQPRDERELIYFGRDVLAELPQRDAAFGITLGDLVNDDLSLLDPLTRMMGLVGIPWYNVIGNHDLNFDAPDDARSDETFERIFGPATYAFEYGHVHFIVLDDIYFHAASTTDGRGPAYDGWLTDRQLRFIESYLAEISAAERVVLLMHIPLVGSGGHQVPQRDRLFRLLAGHPHTLSISGHSHIQVHHFLGEESGNPGPVHHHFNSGTTSGGWWTGQRDEDGIPHATMRDGTPNGYSIVTFEGSDYRIRFKAARRPADHQMNIHAPDVTPYVALGDGSEAPGVVEVNVFGGSPRSRVEMRLVPGHAGTPTPWISMEGTLVRDAAYVIARQRETASPGNGAELPSASPSGHIWQASLPEQLAAGTWWIEVRATDLFGRVDRGRRVLRVQ